MKKISTIIMGIVLSISILKAQEPIAPPQSFSYMATIMKGGTVIANKTVTLRVSILQNNAMGVPKYIEKFTAITNSAGQINIEIGHGIPQLGYFPDIAWSEDKYFLKVEVDTKGGTNYTEISVTQLLSVPYALYAGAAGSAANINEKDPLFSESPASGITSINISDWMKAYSWGDHAGLYRLIDWVPAWSEVTDKPEFAKVATTADYADLINTPTPLTETDIEGYIANDVTASYVPRDDGTKLVSGTIFDDGTKVGIGTSTPTQKLDVLGNIRILGNIFSSDISAGNINSASINAAGAIHSNSYISGTDIIAGSVTASKIVNAGIVSSTGNITSGADVKGDNFVYNAAQTKYLSIPGSTGILSNPYSPPVSGGILYGMAATSYQTNYLYYPVHLPDGAVIKGFKVLSTFSGGQVSAMLGKITGSDLPDYNVLSIAYLNDNPASSWHWSNEESCSEVVNNDQYSYIISVTNQTPVWTYIGRILIRYEVTKP